MPAVLPAVAEWQAAVSSLRSHTEQLDGGDI